jgi:hypothetical protein
MLLLLLMTIAQLFTQMSQNLSKVPSAMSALQQAALVRAANAGLAEFVDLLPDLRKTEAKTERLGAAQSKTIGATAASKGFTVAWDEQANFLGRTVVVGNDSSRYNRLQALNTLLFAHEGATGSTTLEVRADAILLGSLEDAVDGEVTLVWETGAKELLHGRPEHQRPEDVLALEVGEPERWWIEPLNGITGGATPLYLLRLWPQPDAVYSLLYTRRLWPSALTVTAGDYATLFASTTELPVLPREEQALVAMCERGMIGTALWIGSADQVIALQNYQHGVGQLASRSTNRGHSQRAKIYTKRGY